MEITPPSIQRQQIAELEKSSIQNIEQQMKVTTSKTVNKLGTEIIVSTLSPHEQQIFTTKTDWKIRYLSNNSLLFRTKNIFVNNTNLVRNVTHDNGTNSSTKNLLEKFICISDLKIQVGGFIYGSSPPDNAYVKEIKCILIPPQIGNYQSVTLSTHMPSNKYLHNLEILGWIHTQTTNCSSRDKEKRENESNTNNDDDDLTNNLKYKNVWDKNKSIILTCSFTPGSCTINAFKLTDEGYNLYAYANANNLYEQVQVLLSNVFVGFFLLPDDGIWNYNLMGIKFSNNLKYTAQLDIPKPFYADIHRPNHFLQFAMLEQHEGDEADVETSFI
uniref:PROCT domain-containing protein n=1 Tax=Piliocolobus tephrosceles TaxID=591936 RepID=A0A8C9LSU7_9PRIM